MARFETWLKSDLSALIHVEELQGSFFTADVEGNLIGVEVFNNGQPANLAGAVTAFVIRSDDETVLINGALSGNRASIILPASAYVTAGPVSIVIKVGTTTVGACHGYVHRTSTNTIVDPAHIVPSLEELLEHINDAIAAANTANTAATGANTAAASANSAATAATNAAASANSAATAATNAATTATNAAAAANTAASTANTAASKIDNMTVAGTIVGPGQISVTISEVSGHKHIAFGIPQGPKGDAGKDFRIKKTFTSIAQMQAYDPDTDPSSSKMTAYDFAMIDTGSVEDPDTGKLYCYEPAESVVWHYIGDLSGKQGIKGETGNGIDHIALNQDYTLTVYFTDGTSYTTTSIRGAAGATGNGIANIVQNQDDTLTITMDDSTTYTTNPVRGPKGDTGDPGTSGCNVSYNSQTNTIEMVLL